jgi:methionyl-tRNA formyltransferase
MRVVTFGYQTWGHRTLRALLDSDHEVALAITHPKSDHAYEKIWSDSVADLAERHGAPVPIRNRPDDEELMSRLEETDPDIIVANNWRTWLPPQIFTLPRHWTRNVHDSLLSAYAGFSPLIWAIINGENEVVIVAGADARCGHNRGLAIKRVRTDDDSEYAATEHFRTMGGYLTSHP